MTNNLKKLFAAETAELLPSGVDIRLIISSARDSKAIISAFGGDKKLALTLNAIETINRRCPSIKSHVFKRIPGESGKAAAQRLVDLTDSWDKGARPSLPAIAREWLDEFGIDRSHPYAQALMLVAARAEMVHGFPPQGTELDRNEPVYHNRIHTLQVFQTACYLMQAQRELQEKMLTVKDPLFHARMDDESICAIMISAMAHDIDHPGRGNPKDPDSSRVVDFFNEDASSAAIYPLVTSIGDRRKGQNLHKTIETYIRFTDPGVPRQELRKAVEDLRKGKLPHTSSDFYTRPDTGFWAGAAILADSDLLFSCGAGRSALDWNSVKLTEEAQKAGLKMDFSNPKSNQFFFDNIVGRAGFLSGSARILFNPLYHGLRRDVANRLQPIAA